MKLLYVDYFSNCVVTKKDLKLASKLLKKADKRKLEDCIYNPVSMFPIVGVKKRK
jgi:hypothetical protein